MDVVVDICRRVGKEVWGGGGGKKVLTPQEEAVKVIADIVTLISVKYFDLAMGEVIAGALLKPVGDGGGGEKELVGGLERFMMGLRAVHSMYYRVLRGKGWGRGLGDGGEKGTSFTTFRYRALGEVLKREREAGGVKGGKDYLVECCGTALEYLFPLLDGVLGGWVEKGGQTQKTLGDLVGNSSMKVALLSLLDSCLGCLSIALPWSLVEKGLVGMVCRYTMHLCEKVRRRAREVVFGLICFYPSLRGMVVKELCGVLRGMSEGGGAGVVGAVSFLYKVLFRWHSIARGEGPDSPSNFPPSSLDIPFLEGTLLLYFCRPEQTLREYAFNTLYLIHSLLPLLPPSSPVILPSTLVVDALKKYGALILARAKRSYGAFVYDYEVFEELKNPIFGESFGGFHGTSTLNLISLSTFSSSSSASSSHVSSPSGAMSEKERSFFDLQQKLPSRRVTVSGGMSLIPGRFSERSGAGGSGIKRRERKNQFHHVDFGVLGFSFEEENRGVKSRGAVGNGAEEMKKSGAEEGWGEGDGHMHNKKSQETLKSQLLGGEGGEWGVDPAILGEIARVFAEECPEACQSIHSLAVERMEAAHESLGDIERDHKNTQNSFPFYQIWRNYLTVAMATAQHGEGEGDGGVVGKVLGLVKGEGPVRVWAVEFSMCFVSPKVMSSVFGGLVEYLKELSKVKKVGGRKDGLRVHVANIVRGCAFSISIWDEMEEERRGKEGGGRVREREKEREKGMERGRVGSGRIGGGRVGVGRSAKGASVGGPGAGGGTGAGGAREALIADNVFQSFVSYIQESFNFLSLHADSPSLSLNWTILALKYSLFATIPLVMRASYHQDRRRHEQLFWPEYRRDLYHFLAKFVGVGGPSKNQKGVEQKHLEELVAKMKGDEREGFRERVMGAVGEVERVAGEGMGGLVLGGGFETGAFDRRGVVFEWVSSMFREGGKGEEQRALVGGGEIFKGEPLNRREAKGRGREVKGVGDKEGKEKKAKGVISQVWRLSVGRMAVVEFVKSNSAKIGSLVPILVDLSYLPGKENYYVAHNFFLCLCEIVMTTVPLPPSPCSCQFLGGGVGGDWEGEKGEEERGGSERGFNIASLLLLGLFKLTDQQQGVREAAGKLLVHLCDSYFQTTGGWKYYLPLEVGVRGGYVESAARMANKLAVDRPELTGGMLEEVMGRVRDMEKEGREGGWQLLWCFSPWVRNIDLNCESGWGKAVLRALFVLTLKVGGWGGGDKVMERVWELMGRRKGNVEVVLSFLFDLGVLSQNDRCVPVCREVGWWVGRAAAGETIEYLVEELGKLGLRGLGLEKVGRRELCESEFFDMEGDGGEGRESSGSNGGSDSSGLSESAGTKEESAFSSTPTSTTSTPLSAPSSASPSPSPTPATSSSASSTTPSPAPPASPLSTLRDPCSCLPPPLENFSSWDLSEIFPPQPFTHPFSRSHFAIFLLSDLLASRVVESVMPFLPRILHAVFLAGDHPNGLVPPLAHSLLLHTLLGLFEEKSEEQQAESAPSFTSLFPPTAPLFGGKKGGASQLGEFLEKMEILREFDCFWDYEDLSHKNLYLPSVPIMSDFVEYVVGLVGGSVGGGEELRERWGKEALQTALGAESTHVFGRSLQIYRALKPKMSPEDLGLLVGRLREYMRRKKGGEGEKGEGVCVGLEVVLTLKEGVRWLERDEVVKMPQFFWVGVGLLLSNDPLEYFCGVSLLSTVLETLEFTSNEVQKYLFTCFPYHEWKPPFMGFLGLVLKGLTNRQTEKMSLEVLRETAWLRMGGVIDLDPKRRLLLNMLGLLPHLCLYMGKEGTGEMAKGLSCMFDYSGSAFLDNSSVLANIFQRYSVGGYGGTKGGGVGRFIDEVVEEVGVSFFPMYELLLFSFLVEVLEGGNSIYEGIVLLLIDRFLGLVRLGEAGWGVLGGSLVELKGMGLFGPVEKRLRSKHYSLDSLSILKKVVLSGGGGEDGGGLSIKIAHAKHMNVMQRLQEFVVKTNTWEETYSSSFEYCDSSSFEKESPPPPGGDSPSSSSENVLCALDQIISSFEKTENLTAQLGGCDYSGGSPSCVNGDQSSFNPSPSGSPNNLSYNLFSPCSPPLKQRQNSPSSEDDLTSSSSSTSSYPSPRSGVSNSAISPCPPSPTLSLPPSSTPPTMRSIKSSPLSVPSPLSAPSSPSSAPSTPLAKQRSSPLLPPLSNTPPIGLVPQSPSSPLRTSPTRSHSKTLTQSLSSPGSRAGSSSLSPEPRRGAGQFPRGSPPPIRPTPSSPLPPRATSPPVRGLPPRNSPGSPLVRTMPSKP